MSAQQLLATTAFCLVAGIAACDRVEQRVGLYDTGGRVDAPAGSALDPNRGGSVAQAGAYAVPGGASGPNGPTQPNPVDGMADPNGASMSSANPLPDGTGRTDPGCVVEAQPRRLDMYLMIDSNLTLPGGVVEIMADGLSKFVTDMRSSGTGVGVRYFGMSCDAIEYSQPTIEVDMLPMNADAIIRSTRDLRPSASPMLAALEGGLMHQRARSGMHPDWKQVVVLVSDGFSQDVTCRYTPQELADTARRGVGDSPSVETHVLGVNVTTGASEPLDDFLTNIGPFNTIAAAGGSRAAVTTGFGDDGATFSEALQRVRKNALPCEYHAPAGLGPGQFELVRYPETQLLPSVSDASACGAADGWYYAAASEPTPVTLCPNSCAWLREADDRRLGIAIGCTSIVR